MKVVKNYIYNVIYQILILILPFITIPYISKVLGASGIGINAYTASIMQYFILFASLGINTYGNREIAYYQHDKAKVSSLFWEIYSLKIILTVLIYGLFLIFLYFVHDYKWYYFYQSFSLIAVAFDISWLFMGLEDFKKIIIRNCFVKIISLICIFTLVKDFNDLGVYILILSLSTLIGNITLFPYLSKLVYPFHKVTNLKPFKHLKSTFILFIPQISVSLYIVLNKTILGFFKGSTAVGYYENADKLIVIVIALLTATKTVLMPRVANLHSQGKHEETKNLLYSFFSFLSFLSIPATIGLMVISHKFALWFFGNEFSMTGIALIFYAPSLIFNAWNTVIGQQYLLPLNRMKEYNMSIFVAAIMTVFLDLFVVVPFGVYGIAFISTISELIVAGVQLFYIRHEIDFYQLFQSYFKMLISASVMGIVLYYLNSYLEMSLLNLGIEVIVSICIYVMISYFLKVNIVMNVIEQIKK